MHFKEIVPERFSELLIVGNDFVAVIPKELVLVKIEIGNMVLVEKLLSVDFTVKHHHHPIWVEYHQGTDFLALADLIIADELKILLQNVTVRC